MASLPTVAIADGKGGYVVINEADYSDSEHQLYEWQTPKLSASSLSADSSTVVDARRVQLADKTVTEQRAIAKELGLTGYSRLKETELIDLIIQAEAGADAIE